MKLWSSIMMALTTRIEKISLREAEAAKALGVTQPRLADFIRGKINAFEIDDLIAMASAVGMHSELRIAHSSQPA